MIRTPAIPTHRMMQVHNQQALSRINGRVAFVMQQTVDNFISGLTQFAGTDPESAGKLEASARESIEFCYSIGAAPSEDRKCFIYNDGIAIIPIHGSLINRFGGSWGFVTGYQAIRRQMNAALEDDDVKVIVFDVDSPGGEAAGCFELAEEIRASREIKPSIAVVDSLSASAGYALASAATRMVATPSSKVGSIGVVAMHIDFSGALDQAGIEITYIEAPKGGMKTAGTPYRRLDKRAEAYFQDFVDAGYEDFVALIGENRGLEDAAIRETEARVFRAEEALALGLIDEVKTPSEAVSTFLAELADDEPSESEDEDMTTKTPTGAAAPEATSAPTAEQLQAAVTADRERMAAIKALPEAAEKPKLAETLAMGGYSVEQAKPILAAAASETAAALPDTKADDQRTAAIKALPEAAKRPKLAETLAVGGYTAEQAKPILAAALEEGAAAPAVDDKNHLENAMDTTKHPNVGAGSGEGGGGGPGAEKSDAELSQSILADHAAATGRSYEPAK
jgi:signal peptide peptidase SppA